MNMLNPNCSETVVRLKRQDLYSLSEREKRLYRHLVETYSSDEPTEGYSKLRSDGVWKAHYYYQTVGNELIAFALWVGIDFDTDDVWNCTDLMSYIEDGEWDRIQEELSYWFTYFESWE